MDDTRWSGAWADEPPDPGAMQIAWARVDQGMAAALALARRDPGAATEQLGSRMRDVLMLHAVEDRQASREILLELEAKLERHERSARRFATAGVCASVLSAALVLAQVFLAFGM